MAQAVTRITIYGRYVFLRMGGTLERIDIIAIPRDLDPEIDRKAPVHWPKTDSKSSSTHAFTHFFSFSVTVKSVYKAGKRAREIRGQ